MLLGYPFQFDHNVGIIDIKHKNTVARTYTYIYQHEINMTHTEKIGKSSWKIHNILNLDMTVYDNGKQ